MAIDWFRKRSWSEKDQSDFWQRLARAKTHNRAQYIFIQGYTLKETGSQYWTSATSLFDHVIENYPDSINFVQALSAKADCLLSSGDIDGALQYYDRAVERMRIMPNIQTWAWLDLTWVVATRRLSHQYEKALDLLDEFGRAQLLFPVVAFRIHGSRALIQSARGQSDLGAQAARSALSFADTDSSGLRYHPKIGVVGARYEDIRAQLAAIAVGT